MQVATPIDPAVALVSFALIAGAFAAALWPRYGIAARVRRTLRISERVRIEDTLKHLLRCELEGRRGSIENVAGALQVTRARAVRILERLEAMNLVRADGEGFPLSDTGRAYALRIVRTHRLWERYLADRTGVRPEDWHEQAEEREHSLSESEAERLAASLGHPLYDPHGDPIPTAAGALPPRRGVALTALKPGDTGIISHLEDEPAEIFERLIREKLALRMRVELLDGARGEVRFRSERGVHALPPIVANNITVEPVPVALRDDAGALTLADIAPGESARVLSVSTAYAEAPRRRLLDLGVVPGTVVRAEFRGAAGGPMAYRVRDALIALRAEQAMHIDVERVAAHDVEHDVNGTTERAHEEAAR